MGEKILMDEKMLKERTKREEIRQNRQDEKEKTEERK